MKNMLSFQLSGVFSDNVWAVSQERPFVIRHSLCPEPLKLAHQSSGDAVASDGVKVRRNFTGHFLGRISVHPKS